MIIQLYNYIAISYILRIILVISPVIASDYHLDIGNNRISYPFEVAQAIEDAIPDENLDNIVAISNGGNIRYKIGSNWYGSLKSFEPHNDYWFYTNNSFTLVFNEPSDNISNEFEYCFNSFSALS